MQDNVVTAPAPTAKPPAPARSGIAPFLFTIALAGEILSLLLMTLYRYRNQGLEPQFLDFSKTANLLALLLEIPFLGLFTVLLAVRRYHIITLAAPAAMMSLIGLVVLTAAPMITLPERLLPNMGNYVGYVLFLAVKAVELAGFVVTLREPLRSFWRKGLSVVIFAAGFMAGSFAIVIAMVLLSPIGSTIIEQPSQEYDAGVILGAAVWSGDRPSPVLRERLNKGYDLLKNGTVQFLVLTGGHAPNELPEAEVGRRELLKLGVDPTRIVLETSTSSTLEQILFIRDQLQRKQGWSSFIIISDQFHLKRALEICQFNGINALGVSSESPLGPQNLAVYHVRESVALILYWLFGV
jgi:vancomycin permeability regulator SanA